MKNDLILYACKRIKCERYGNFNACKQHHHAEQNLDRNIGSKDNKLSLQVTSGDIAILKNNY